MNTNFIARLALTPTKQLHSEHYSGPEGYEMLVAYNDPDADNQAEVYPSRTIFVKLKNCPAGDKFKHGDMIEFGGEAAGPDVKAWRVLRDDQIPSDHHMNVIDQVETEHQERLAS